jgi:hypothetical protein
MQPTPALRSQLVEMIRVSNNAAATAALNQVGFQQIADAVGQLPHRLYEPEDGGSGWARCTGRTTTGVEIR